MQIQEFKQATNKDIPHSFSYIELCPVFYNQHHWVREDPFTKLCFAKLVGIEILSDSPVLLRRPVKN